MGVSQQNIYYLIFVGTIIIFLLVTSIVLFFYLYQKKIHKQQQEMSAIILRHQEELLYANWQMVEEERKRVSKDFHDEIGSIFSMLSMLLGTLGNTAVTDAQAKQSLKQGQQLIDAGVKNMRRILYDIVPPDIEIFGLNNTILILCERVNSTSPLYISFQEKGSASTALGKKYELTLYRIIQELINNTVKHAAADKAELELVWLDQELHLYYTDNGKGFELNKPLNRGLGLRNIESRAKMIHADIEWNAGVEKGMKFTLKLSIDNLHE